MTTISKMEKLPGDKPGKPIPISPDLEWTLTRLLCLPVGDTRDKRYMHVPCTMKITAWTAGEASMMADEIKYNTQKGVWPSGMSMPPKDFHQVDCPPELHYELTSR
jgi:hypothetical protein